MRDSRLKPRPRSEIIQGAEEEKYRKRMRWMTNSQKNSIPVVDDDLVVDQILTRLPVKSLMRFKCVCKPWKSIIEQDSHFIYSHNAGSQSRLPGLLMIPSCIKLNGKERLEYESSFFSAELHCADDDSDGGSIIKRATVHRLGGSRRIRSSCQIVRHLGPVRGLLCLVDQRYAVQICNPSTGQAVTPWIKPTQVMNRNLWGLPRCQFGFDPSTGEYKVVFLGDDPAVCAVLTVGVDASWRIIDQVPPLCKPYGDIYGDISAYVNGSIYWITFTAPTKPYGAYFGFLMAFDVGSEKFRMIKIPGCTYSSNSQFPYVRLLEMDGCLTVVHGKYQGAGYKDTLMWKFHDNDKLQGINGTSSSNEPEQHWSKVTIELPSYIDALPEHTSLHPIPGKDVMIIETHNPPHHDESQMAHVKFPSYYSYNMINKTLSKFELQLPSSLLDSKLVRCAIFAECLFSVTSNLTYTGPPISLDPPPIAIYPWVRSLPIAIYPWQAPPTQQGFLPPQVGHYVGQFGIAPPGFPADDPPNHPNEQYDEEAVWG